MASSRQRPTVLAHYRISRQRRGEIKDPDGERGRAINLHGAVSKEAFDKIVPIYEQSRQYSIERDEAEDMVEVIAAEDGHKEPERIAFRIISCSRLIMWEPGAARRMPVQSPSSGQMDQVSK